MDIRPAKIYSFSLGRQSFRVRWFWDEYRDEEAFTLDLLEKNISHGVVGNIEEFLSSLPFVGTYAEAEAILKGGIRGAISKGWIVRDTPLNLEHL
jgi:hypothetical protein